MYTSIFRKLGKEKPLFEVQTQTRFEKGDYIVHKKKTYKIVNREYHFKEGEDHIHYNVGHIPKGTGLVRVIHEFVISVLALFNKF
jgi:hypothetical protein